jgi:Fe(II)/alpha-ketoglutarate-dependent arginine beta-hydroxylase
MPVQAAQAVRLSRVELSLAARRVVDGLVAELIAEHDSTDDPRLCVAAALAAHELPRDLRQAFERFRHDETRGVLLVHTEYREDARIGPTPSHWKDRPHPSPTLDEEVKVALLGSLLGDVFGWGTQQDGRLIHDILPIRGTEHQQLGSSSSTTLTWHTEDAFHEHRPDYIGLYCLRNPDGIATTVAEVEVAALSDGEVNVLFEPRFLIRPDKSHTAEFNFEASVAGRGNDSRFGSISRRDQDPDPVPALFGGRDAPYVRLDPEFMSAVPGDDEAARALTRLHGQVDEALFDLVLAPGDACFVDNLRVVHGRKPFRARFDGTDRWLKRVCVTRDLRRSRQSRQHATSRVIL